MGCTEARLFGDGGANDPDKTKIVANVCTSDPADRDFPVRVLFLVDTSVADGQFIQQRGDSIERVTRAFPGANFSFGVIRYSGQLRGTACGFRNLTPDGFTKNLEDAIAGVRCADTGNVGRDLSGALSLASSVITGDVLTTPIGTRSRTKYVVVMLANGAPTISLPLQWCRSRIPPVDDAVCDGVYFQQFCEDVQPPPPDCERYQYGRFVTDMREFVVENGGQEFFFHTVYQRDPDATLAGQDDQGALDLFSNLTLQGRGTLYRFLGPGICDLVSGDTTGCLFSAINLDSTESVFQRKQLIVSNRNALSTGTGLLPDSDQDGLEDELEHASEPTQPWPIQMETFFQTKSSSS